MAFGIPMQSGNTMETFNKAFGLDNILKQALERKRLGQQNEQYKQNFGQRENHFLQNLALQKEQLAHTRANEGLQRQIHEQNLLRLKHQNDPLGAVQDFEALKNYYTSRGQNKGSMNGEQQPVPHQSLGEGMGAFSPEGLQDAQQAPQMSGDGQMGGGNASGLSNEDFELMKQNPGLRAAFIQKFKIDPLKAFPQSPQEKQAGAINQAVSIDEAKSNRKKIDEIEKTYQALIPYIGKVNTIEDILKRKPDLAGRTTQLADMLGMTEDEDVGTFVSAAQALQAHMAKEMSSRGGYGVSRLVEQAKPNIGKSNAYNTGVIKDLKQSMKSTFEQMKSEYERLSHGKKFPYDFEQYFKEVAGDVAHNTGQQSGGGKRLKFNLVTGRLE